jgi:ApaG protein
MSIIKTAITQGVKVTAYPKYIPDESKPLEGRFFHAYRITIQNNSANTIQLLKRHWNIYDTIGGMRSIQGEGVVGETPVLKKGDTYSYTSCCPLSSSIGYMDGFFQFVDLQTENQFTVKIPHFDLLMPGVFN